MTRPYEIKCTWNPQTDPWRGVGVSKMLRFCRANGTLRMTDTEDFLLELAELSYRYGYNFDVLAAMWYLETDLGRKPHWGERLNPGSIGIGDVTDLGYKWDTGEDAAKAMIAHFSVYVSGWREDMARDGILGKNPRYFAVWEEPNFPKSVNTVAQLGNGRWASDPSYATKVATRYDSLRALK